MSIENETQLFLRDLKCFRLNEVTHHHQSAGKPLLDRVGEIANDGLYELRLHHVSITQQHFPQWGCAIRLSQKRLGFHPQSSHWHLRRYAIRGDANLMKNGSARVAFPSHGADFDRRAIFGDS